MTKPLALSGAPIVLEFETAAAGPPVTEPLDDGRLLFKIKAEGSIAGVGWNGAMHSVITEVNPDPAVYQGVAITFTIETEAGALEGYYAGSIHHPLDSSLATINAHGQVLSVSAAYVDLFLANVMVKSEVEFVAGRSVGETGTLTISPR